MKQVEIKRFTIGSVIKSTLYLYFIPIILLLLFGLILTLIAVIEEGAIGFLTLLVFIAGAALYTGLYIGILALMTLIYNWLAGKFGGLTFTIEEKNEITQNN
ncbi:hypothetical protein [Bacillus sp. JCM 19041]|uniref:hypothetical protein n=1 Tax=Bacillus sp. JCM 19041 TaxID=1460637 RepID=UPI0006D079CB